LRADSLAVKVRLARVQYDQVTAANELASRKEQLNRLLARDTGTDFRVSPAPEAQAVVIDLPAAQRRASRRPELSAAQLQIKQAEYELRMKKAEYIPDLSLVATYFRPITSEVLPRNIAFVGVELNWDVFDWGRKKREMADRQRAVAQAQNQEEETREQILAEANDRARKVEAARTLVRVTELAIEAERERLRVTREQFTKAALLRDVLEARTALAEAGDRYRQSLLGFWTAQADFDQAVGED
jgi:outer membrane protein